jgi:hypothetical protein
MALRMGQESKIRQEAALISVLTVAFLLFAFQLTSVDAALSHSRKKSSYAYCQRIMCQRTEPMPDKALDPVEWELVRADIAMEKARLKANGDWSKWEEFQTRTNAILERALIGWRALRGRGLPMTEDERIALWWAVRTPELPWLMAPPRWPRRPGWPLR